MGIHQEHLEQAITELYEPVQYIQDSDEQFTTQEILERIQAELPIDFEPMELITSLKSLGFMKLPIEGTGFWLVKFAQAPDPGA